MHSIIFGVVLCFGRICSSAADCTTYTPGVYTFGSECQYMCHCKNGASCNTDTGECSVGCDTNWFGPACQYRDLAEAQYPRHNSNQKPEFYSPQANDGDTSTCSKTQTSDRSKEEPWWKVWFPRNETTRDIYILTEDTSRKYFPGFEVTVEYVPEGEETNLSYVPTYKHTCYQHSDTVPESTSIYVQCDQPVVGNQVRITLATNESQLVLCDVKIGAGRNFAFRQPVSASQHESSYIPFNTVDGRLVSSGWTGCYVANNANQKYLDINLGHPVDAFSVDINTVSDDYIQDYQIYAATTEQTDLRLVYDDTGNTPPVTYVHLNTDVQTLRILRNSPNRLVICELEIYGECRANKCGYDCSENCFCNSQEDYEHRISGVCTTGCQLGWTGPNGKCNYGECEENEWGIQCQNECGFCRVGTCNVVSGECNGGCKDGHQDTTECKTECLNGTYGEKCGSSCNSHCMNPTCNKTNGVCTGGCKAGYTGDKCDQECPDGTYDINCAQSCSVNCEDVCDHVQGTCTTCKAGWKGDYCDTECDAGTYGIDCTQDCVPRCDASCDHVNGQCSQCPPGWKGNFCEIECDIGKYGIGCAGSCGFCTVHTSCDTETGICPSGCMDGYTGATCNQDIEQSLQSNTVGIIAGSVVAGIVVICVTIIVVCVVMYRRSQQSPVITEPANRVEMSNDPTSASYEDIHQNEYMNDKEETNYEIINPE